MHIWKFRVSQLLQNLDGKTSDLSPLFDSLIIGLRLWKINIFNSNYVEVICKKVGLEPDRSWVHLKIKSVWLKSITSCKLFLKNHIIQLIYSVLNKSTINKREISTGINHIFNLFWSPVLVESSCMKLRNKKKNRKILQSLIIVTTCWGGIGVSSVKWQMFWKTYQSSPHPASQDHDHR